MHDHDARMATEFDRWVAEGRAERMGRGHAHLVDAAFDRWDLRGARVLDVGCGAGFALRTARERGADGLAGVDVSPRMIERARLHVPGADVRVASGDALPWPNGVFTHALSIESLYYHLDPEASLREMARVVAAGGRVGTAIELYAENEGSARWVEALDVPVHRWSTPRWVDAFERAGLVDVRHDRFVDPTPLPPVSAFEPSRWYASWDDYAAYRRAGALWVEGRRPG